VSSVARGDVHPCADALLRCAEAQKQNPATGYSEENYHWETKGDYKEMSLEKRVAIVTGAGSPRGIGRAIAMTLAEKGADVVVCDLDPAGAEKVAEEIMAMKRSAMAVRPT
jgi:D-arabinose 5-phosphate isomerase GutQ